MSAVVAVGRRKTSVARVFVDPAKAGKGVFSCNQREFPEYFPIDILQIIATEPFKILGVSPTDFDIRANLSGGGISGQAEALRLGITRCLMAINPEHRPALKKAGMVTRDPRAVERKKFGRAKARKRFQFSKR